MDKHIAEKTLSLSRDLKVEAAEVFLRSYTSTTIEVKDQKVDAFDRARDIGGGLRVLINGRMGFAFTTDLSEEALKTLAQTAVTNAQNTEPDEFQSIPNRPSSAYQTVEMYAPDMIAIT
jgi:PmbA protein